MNTQATFFLSILRRYVKVCIPVTAILLALLSPSLALADNHLPHGCPTNQYGTCPQMQVYARVWSPTTTRSIRITTQSCDASGCNGIVYSWCRAVSAGGYTDIGWQGWVHNLLNIRAYTAPHCAAAGYTNWVASDYISHTGDCWFDIPDGSVSGPCTGKTDPNAG